MSGQGLSLFVRRNVVWMRFGLAIILAAGLLLTFGWGLAQAQDGFKLLRLTHASDPSNRDANYPEINYLGTKIVFDSDSDYFNEGDVYLNKSEIWLYETATQTVTRMTRNTCPNCASSGASLNANGTRIAFHSDSDFLNQGIIVTQNEIWLYDTSTMTYTRITTASVYNRTSWRPAINADGTRIAFESWNNHLGGPASPLYMFDIWLYDTTAMTYTRITTGTASNKDSLGPSISGDGARIVFQSGQDLLNEGLSGAWEIWLYDTTTMTYTRVSTSYDGRESGMPRISGDGSTIVFHSDSEMAGESVRDNQPEIWTYDIASGSLQRLTYGNSGTGSVRPSQMAVPSWDGSRVVFVSRSDFLNEGLPANIQEIWVYDQATDSFNRVTQTSDPTTRSSTLPVISGNGQRVAFQSDSDFHSEGIINGQDEIWGGWPVPAFEVTKSVDDPAPSPGARVTYTVRVTNTSLIDTSDSVISDTLDSNLALAGTIVLQPGSAGTVGSLPTLASGVDLDAHESLTITFPVTVSAATADQTWITNTATISNSEIDAAVDGQVMMQVTVYTPALEIAKTVDESQPQPGQVLTYAFVISNSGNLAASGVVLSDTLSIGLSFVGPVELVGGSGGSLAQTAGDLPDVVTDLTIADGETVTVTLPVMVDTDVAAGTLVPNLAAVTCNEIPQPASSQVDLTVAEPDRPQLALTKTVDDSQPKPGQGVVFQFIINNTGTGPASGVVLSDTLSTGLSFVGPVELVGGSGGSLAQTAGDLPGVVTDLTIADGETVTVTLPVMVDTDVAAGTLVPNLAEVTCNEIPQPASSQVDLTVAEPDRPQLALAKTADDSQPKPGQGVVFQFIINNTGTGPASGVVLSDTLPSGLSFVGPVELAGGSGGSLAQKAGDLPDVVTDLTIAAGETVTVSLPVEVDAGLADGMLIPNLAELTSNELTVPAASKAELTVSVDESPMLYLPVVIRTGK